MFARFLELAIKTDATAELTNKIREEILPILKQYDGFFDLIPLETGAASLYLISLWHEKVDAEKYEKESFLQVRKIYEPFLTKPIVVKLCRVDETIPTRMIALAKMTAVAA